MDNNTVNNLTHTNGSVTNHYENSDVQVMWKPRNITRASNIYEFQKRINKKFGLNLESYWDLHKWSVEKYPEFWEEVWKFCNVIYSVPPKQIVDRNIPINQIPKWFVGSRLNYAENLLRYRDDKVALYFAGENCDKVEKVTFRELYDRVSRVSAALKSMGITKGDVVAGYLPNCPQTVEIMLATAAIGAIFSSTSPDFGVSGVLDRFSQVKPKVLFSVNNVIYNGKVHSHLDKLSQVVSGLQDLGWKPQVVVIPYVQHQKSNKQLCELLPQSLLYDNFLSLGVSSEGNIPELIFEQVPFDHPLFIMYSSGTTGVPKCIVHSTGGTLLKHLSEHVFHSNMGRNDVILYYTTAGWMMWNYLVTSLSVGASVVLYDGSPFIPSPLSLWELVDKIGITILGSSAKWLSALEEKNIFPKETCNLTTLHTILSTGSPLKPHSYDYVYNHIKSDVLLGSVSGGTDIIACFVGQIPNVPVHKGECQGPLLGCHMESWSDEGKSVIGSGGELVCLTPFPSMPVFFWNDDNNILYEKAYFNKFPGIWAHGDYCIVNPDTNGILLLGRSDGTLNPNGVRFGSAEVYNIVEKFPEIEDSVCVGQRNSRDGCEERVVLFVKLSSKTDLSTSLIDRIKHVIRQELSARHVPAVILQTIEIPYTVSGKKVEIAVRQVLEGKEVKNTSAMANPKSLELYRNIPQLQGW